MFKKVELWVVLLLILVGLASHVVFGYLVRKHLQRDKEDWLTPIMEVCSEITKLPRRFVDILTNANPFKLAEDRFSGLSGFTGSPNAKEMYLLNTRYDATLDDCIVELVDLRNFETLHTWNPDLDAMENLKDLGRKTSFRHPILESDGSLVVRTFYDNPAREEGIEDLSLVRLDPQGKLVQSWKGNFHHSLERDADGNYWGCVRHDEKVSGYKFSYLHDGIKQVSPQGETLFYKSIIELFVENEMGYLIFSLDFYPSEDPIHINDVQPVDFDGEYWKKGDVFLSLRNQSMVLLYRPSTNKIIWKGTGHFSRQHDVDILDQSRISIFNNNTSYRVLGEDSFKMQYSRSGTLQGNNQVVIYDFATDQYSLYLDEALRREDVKTNNQGLSRILPDGSLFIVENNYGRMLYFNPDGSTRWTYVNRPQGDPSTYDVSWSRLLYTAEDLERVQNFLTSKAGQ